MVKFLIKIVALMLLSVLTACNVHTYIFEQKYKEKDGWINLFIAFLYLYCLLNAAIVI